jgi:hypothetical protein
MAKIQMSAPKPPPDRPHGTMEDHQTVFGEISAKTPADDAFRAAFIQSKLRIAHTHPTLDLAARDAAVASLIDRAGPQVAEILTQPVPGGVGYGVFYTPPFKTNWGHGTSFTTDFVCPAPPGGNINTFLYLTATNRSGMGVEAFVSYNGQGTPHFRVFDWARYPAAPWQTDVPFTSLGNYLTTVSAHGHPYPVLPVWNSTWLIGANRYRNQALLYNHVRGGWDLVYQYDYAATDAQQKTGWVGSWADIVETFQPLYVHTNQMGGLGMQLISADNNGHWGSWALLSSSNSYVRTDNVGFHLVFLDPNYAFTVNS